MRLIDTSVFIYAVGRPHPYKVSCLRLMEELERGEHEANIDVEVLQEVLYHFWQRGRHRDAVEIFDRLAAAFPEPFPVTLAEARVARDIMSRHPRLEPRDAIHAAVVLVHGLEGIVSTDRGFDSITGLTRFDPMQL